MTFSAYNDKIFPMKNSKWRRNMEKLFVYYSLSGNGDAVAEEFRKHGYKTIKAEEKKSMPKSMVGRILKGGFLAGIGHKSKINDLGVKFSDFENIVIGTPIWNAHPSCAANTLTDMLGNRTEGVDFVLYSGSGNAEKAAAKLKKKFPSARVLSLKQPLNDPEQTAKSIENFII